MAEVASKSSLDKATLSRLQAGKQLNSTLETLVVYVQANGKRLHIVLAPVGDARGAALPKTLAHVAELITDANGETRSRCEITEARTEPKHSGKNPEIFAEE